jgi:hypothetical protein
MKDNCIHLFPYEEASEFSRRMVFAHMEDENEFDMPFDEWDWEYIGFWFATASKNSFWTLQDSLEESIVEIFDTLGRPYDDEDVQRVYGLIE